MYYIAYGSNLNKEQMSKRCPDSKFVSKTILKNINLSFTGMCDFNSFLTIKDGKGKVPVVIYEISDNDLKELDYYEGYPSYYDRIELDVTIDKSKDKPEKAYIYVMNEKYEEHMPTKAYLDTVLKGCIDYDLPDKYVMKAYDSAARKSIAEDNKKVLRKKLNTVKNYFVDTKKEK